MKIWRKSYQVLIIPDNNADPVNVRLSSSRTRLLTVIALLLFIHFVFGFIFYIKFAFVHSKNKRLVATNELLKEDNLRIYQLENTFSKIEESEIRIRNLLGIGGEDSASAMTYPSRPFEKQPDSAIPTYISRSGSEQLSSVEISEQLNFIKKIKSPYHDSFPSIPTLLPVDGLLTSGFEDISRKGELHQGIDLAAQRGSLVRASGDGVVIFSNWTHDLGNLIIIYHGNDFFSFYGHNQIILKQRMSVVQKGDPIAMVGSTGQSSAPHLHFEIWKNGKPIDPKNLIFSLRN